MESGMLSDSAFKCRYLFTYEFLTGPSYLHSFFFREKASVFLVLWDSLSKTLSASLLFLTFRFSVPLHRVLQGEPGEDDLLPPVGQEGAIPELWRRGSPAQKRPRWGRRLHNLFHGLRKSNKTKIQFFLVQTHPGSAWTPRCWRVMAAVVQRGRAWRSSAPQTRGLPPRLAGPWILMHTARGRTRRGNS